ncbi:hypothetical protein [Kluyvera intermedia]|uniref:hypothetical protein n=1 Tax=Kluyvera intermedia TaxID=61648 RepID=UPI00370B3821
MNNWEKLVATAPQTAFPKLGTKGDILLRLLSKGPVTDKDIANEIGLAYRANLQQLMGDACNHWNIKNILDEDGLIIGRELDERHFSGDPEQDKAARAERNVALKHLSLMEAIQAKNRMPTAFAELDDALADLAKLKQNGTPKDAA